MKISNHYPVEVFAGLLLAVLLTLLIVGCSTESDQIQRVVSPESETVLRVPSEYPSLSAAIEAAAGGDTVLVAAGTYGGPGNRDIVLDNKHIIIISEAGPAETIIDCDGSYLEEHFAFMILGRSPAMIISGFTIQNGYSAHGSAMYIQTASPRVYSCVFRDNHATVSGGAVRCKGSDATFRNCTFVNNSATVGGALQVIGGSTPTLERCILAMADDGGAVYSNDGTSVPQMSCCLVYGNRGGDWTGRIADQAALNGNLSEDPQFCGGAGGFFLSDGSPCAPHNNSCGELIGALPVGCE